MGKVELNKKQKKESLLNTAFSLFTSKGFQNTSIAEIVSNAGVAKGTFYLYFTDKYDLRNKLIAHKAATLFLDAYDTVCPRNLERFDDQVIAITDHIIDQLSKDKALLKLISKHLSWGVFRSSMNASLDGNDQSAYSVLVRLMQSSSHKFRDPEVMFYMIIEMVSSTIYSPILHGQPISLEKIKPYLYESIRAQIQMYIVS